MELNKDYKKRDSIIFNEEIDWSKEDDILRFNDMKVDTLKKLINEKYIDPEDFLNNAPTNYSILQFIKNWPDSIISGFVESPDCALSSIVIERVHIIF